VRGKAKSIAKRNKERQGSKTCRIEEEFAIER
jgi:hypothetical protein